MIKFPTEAIITLKKELEHHPVYSAVGSMEALRIFMSCHVFSVWDFMSLLKYLQNHLAPSATPWHPVGDATLRRFINEIVLEEESDQGLPGTHGKITYASHFELYTQAMGDVGADTETAWNFVHQVTDKGIDQALQQATIPPVARDFMRSTFDFIATGKPHVVAAAFALGREHVIPPMFRSLLREMEISREKAPAFHYYLERHIHLDSDQHGPLSLNLLSMLCGESAERFKEAEQAAITALEARITFWDGVRRMLPKA